ncbi:hypothetical protein ACMD2_05021, partial [Ananas comosus]
MQGEGVWQIEALEVDRSCRTAGNQLRRFITSGWCLELPRPRWREREEGWRLGKPFSGDGGGCRPPGCKHGVGRGPPRRLVHREG